MIPQQIIPVISRNASGMKSKVISQCGTHDYTSAYGIPLVGAFNLLQIMGHSTRLGHDL